MVKTGLIRESYTTLYNLMSKSLFFVIACKFERYNVLYNLTTFFS